MIKYVGPVVIYKNVQTNIQCTKAYLQVGHPQHMNTIHKCMANETYSIMQLIQCYT